MYAARIIVKSAINLNMGDSLMTLKLTVEDIRELVKSHGHVHIVTNEGTNLCFKSQDQVMVVGPE